MSCSKSGGSAKFDTSLPSSVTAFASIKQVIDEKHAPGPTPIDEVNVLYWLRILDHRKEKKQRKTRKVATQDACL
jgi:hypothetical protein